MAGKLNASWKIFLILLIGIGLGQVTETILSRGLVAYSTHRHSRLEEIFVKNTAHDVLYLGSSRTHLTIYPRIIDSITGLSTYNAGVEGGRLSEFKMTLDGYLLHHPAPRLIVLTIDPASFDFSRPMFDPTQYFSFIEKNEIVEKCFTSIEKKNMLLKYIPILKVTYMDDYIKNNAIKGLIGQAEMRPGEFDNKGFLSNGTGCIDTNNLMTYTSNNINFQEQAIDMLQAIINTCKENNILLMVTYAPEYRHKYRQKFANFNEFVGLMQNIIQKNQLQFYRDDNLEMNNNPCFFANYGHTNTNGAIEYSKILGQRIKELFNRGQYFQP